MTRKFVFLSIAAALLIALLIGVQQAAWAKDDQPAFRLVRVIDTSPQVVAWQTNLAVDSHSNIYILDTIEANPRVLKYDKHGRFVRSWGSRGSGPGQFEFWPSTPDGGPNAGFIAVDSHDFVYVSDAYNFRVQKFDPNGNFVMQFGEFGFENGQIDPPCAGPISIDQHDNIWIGTFGRVQKFDTQGHALASYGTGGTGNGEFMGAGQTAVDHRGNLYVTDFLNTRVQKLDANGKFLKAWGTPGTGPGQFFMPVTIAVDNEGRLFVGDNTDRIQIFNLQGEFLGQLNPPADYPSLGLGGIAFARNGDIYINSETLIYVFHPRD